MPTSRPGASQSRRRAAMPIEWFPNGQLPNGKPVECRGCALEEAGAGFVPGFGPEATNLVVCGEASGEEEAVPTRCLTCSTDYGVWLESGESGSPAEWRALHPGHLLVGQPFVGRSGMFLTRLMSQAGVPREQAYVTNVCKCRPPFNADPPEQAVLQCRQYLYRELEAIQPNLVVPVGNIALDWFTGHTGIRTYRGSVERLDPARTRGVLQAVPILHPAGIMRSVGKEQESNRNLMISLTKTDLRKAGRLRWSKEPPPLVKNYIIEPSEDQVSDFATSTGLDGYMVDIETPYDVDIYACALLCVGFYDYATARALCLPFYTPGGDYWRPEQELRMIQHVQAMLSRPCDFHNAPFDVPVLESHGWAVNLRDCTQVMDWQLNTENYHALHEVMKRQTDMLYHKDEGKGDPSLMQLPNHRFWNYNCDDTLGQAESRRGLYKDLAHEKYFAEVHGRDYALLEYYQDVSRPMLRHMINMSKRGMWMDEERRQSYIQDHAVSMT